MQRTHQVLLTIALLVASITFVGEVSAESCPKTLDCPKGSEARDVGHSHGSYKVCTNTETDLPHGPQVFCFYDGVLGESGQHVDGKKDGEWVAYFQDGQMASVSHYADGLQHGEWVQVANGNTTRGEYIDGKLSGAMTYENAAGQLISSSNYVDGQLEGRSELFYESGNPKSTTEFVNNLRHGTLEEFAEDGEVTRRSTFEEGEELERCTANEKGALECQEWVRWSGWYGDCVMQDDKDRGPHIIEDQATFDTLLKCTTSISVDWSKHRLWVSEEVVSSIRFVNVQGAQPGADGGIEVVVTHGNGCSGMAPQKYDQVIGIRLARGEQPVVEVAGPFKRRDCPRLP